MTSALNPRFSFETFVVGAANRLAVTAGRTVAENPGSAYNPLFIYSGSGLGKTHVLMAIGHAAKTIAAQLNIEYLTLDEYVEAFHAAIAAGQGDAFRRRFQNVDVLLVDDVQFLTNRKEMQAELLRLTEALQQSGHQIVLASEAAAPPVPPLQEGGIKNGLYSIHILMLDGIDGGNTGVVVLHDGKMRGGDAFFDYVGAYASANGRWRGELVNHEHTPSQGERPVFGGYEVGIGFSGTYRDEMAVADAVALAGKRSIRFSAVLKKLADG